MSVVLKKQILEKQDVFILAQFQAPLDSQNPNEETEKIVFVIRQYSKTKNSTIMPLVKKTGLN